MVPGIALAQQTPPQGPPGDQGDQGDFPRDKAMRKFRAIRIAELQEALGLDDKTTIKISTIMKNNDLEIDKIKMEVRSNIGELKDLMKSDKPDEKKILVIIEKLDKSKKQMQKVHESQFDEIRKLLTPIQQAKFVLQMEMFQKRMHDNIRKSWMERGQGTGGPGGKGMGKGMGPGPGMGMCDGTGPCAPPPDEMND